MGKRPFGNLPVFAALDSRLERGLTAERCKELRRSCWIVAGCNHVAEAKRVGLIFLLAGEAESLQLDASARSSAIRLPKPPII